MTFAEPSDIELTRNAAQRGAAAAMERFRSDVEVSTKATATDFVTDADIEAQRGIVELIERERPDDRIVAEEVGQPSKLPSHGRTWVIDPIDGTGNFMRGSPLWTTSVTLIEGTRSLASANVMPVTGDTYLAGPDGFTVNGRQASVSDRTNPDTFAVAAMMGWGPGGVDGVASICRTVTDRFGELHRFRTGQTTMSMVAAGQLDGGITFSPGAPWDRLAGVHMIRQAGGTATDLRGDRWTMDAEGLVISNGHAHDALVAAVEYIRDTIST